MKFVNNQSLHLTNAKCVLNFHQLVYMSMRAHTRARISTPVQARINACIDIHQQLMLDSGQIQYSKPIFKVKTFSSKSFYNLRNRTAIESWSLQN